LFMNNNLHTSENTLLMKFDPWSVNMEYRIPYKHTMLEYCKIVFAFKVLMGIANTISLSQLVLLIIIHSHLKFCYIL